MKDNLLKSRICDKTTLYKWLETEKVLYLGNDIKTQVKKTLLYDHDYMLWKFVRALRICEYHYNASDLVGRFWHYGSVIVNGHAKIGKNCQFHGNNCVGNKGVLDEAAPRLGDNVEIGVGAKIIGDIYIADGVKIGANAVVVKSCYNKGATLVGIPALEEEMSKETSVKISYGMFISCIVIVLHHSVGDVFYDVGIWGGVIEYLHEGLFSFSMPFFFFWSGYFMMQKAQKEDIQHIISTKMRSLVIPYFAWNTIWTLFAVMLALIPLNIFSKSAVFVWDGKTVSILKGITLYQYNGQYWYLFQLIILTIFCKLIQRIVENRKLYVTVILLLLAICTIDTKVGFFSIEGLVCYLLGGFYSRNYEDPKLMKIRDNLNTLPKLAYPLSLIVLTVIITVSYETIPEYVLMIENLIACFLFWNCLDYFKHLKVYG